MGETGKQASLVANLIQGGLVLFYRKLRQLGAGAEGWPEAWEVPGPGTLPACAGPSNLKPPREKTRTEAPRRADDALPRAAVTKYCRPGWGRPTQFYCLQSWWLEVQTQGVHRTTLALKVLGEAPSWPPPTSGGSCSPWRSLACRCATLISVFTWPFPRVCLSVSSSLLIRTPVVAFRAHPTPV